MSIKLKGSSDGSVSFDAPADTSPSGSDITLVLPTTVGSAEQFLKNSGTAGTLEFSSMVEDSSANVGIGTTSPGTRLHVNGSTPTMRVSHGSTQIVEIKADTSASILRTTTNHPLLFGTNDTERLRIDSSGNVGINETSPSARLHISAAYNETGLKVLGGAAGYSSPLIVGNASGTEYMRVDDDGRVLSGVTSAPGTVGGFSHLNIKGTSINANGAIGLYRNTASPSTGQGIGAIYFANSDGNPGAYIQGQSDGTWGTNDYPGRSVFFTTADGSSSATERLRIDNAGLITQGGKTGSNHGSPNLLLWGADPTLHISSTGSTNNSSHAGIKFAVAGGSTGDYSKAGIFVERQDSYNDLDMLFAFRSSNDATGVSPSDEKMRIDSNGRLLIGTESVGIPGGDELTIATSGHTGMTIRAGTSSRSSIYMSDGTGGNSEYRGYIEYDHGSDYMRFGSAAAERMRIDSAGRIGIGTTAPSSRFHVVESGDAATLTVSSDVSANALASRLVLGNSVGTARMTVNMKGGGSELAYLGTEGNFPLYFQTNGAERMRLLAGGGLTFNGDTAAANALTDYEEGSWTPSAVNFDGTLNVESADYVKVGRLVHINMYISFSNTVDTSNVLIDGLPFTVNGANNHYSLITAHSNGNIPDLALRPQGTTTRLTAVYLNNGDGDAKPNYNHVRGQFIIAGGTYYTT